MVSSMFHMMAEAHGKKDIAKEFNTLGMHFNPNALLY